MSDERTDLRSNPHLQLDDDPADQLHAWRTPDGHYRAKKGTPPTHMMDGVRIPFDQ